MSNERRRRELPALLILGFLSLGGGAALAQPEQSTPEVSDNLGEEQPPLGGDTAPLPSAETEEDAEREYVATAISLGGGRDSGFVLDGVELEDDVFLVRPSIVVDRRPSERSQFLLAYDPEAQFFDQYRELDSIEHAAGMFFERDTARRSKFSFGGSWLDGEDPGRKLDAVLLVLPRTPYQQWRGWTGFEHRWQRTTALLTYIHSDTRIDPAAGLLPDGVDQADDTAALTLTHVVGRRLDLFVGYAYSNPTSRLTPTTDDEFLVPLDEPLQTLTIGFMRQLGTTLSVLLSAGAAETEGDVSPLAALELVRTGRDFGLRLRYDLSLLSLGATGAGLGVTGARPTTIDTAFRDSTSHTLSLDLDYRLARRVRWVQALRGTSAELPDGESIENFAIATRLVFEVLPRLAPFVQGELLEQSGSESTGEPFSRYHLTAGFVIGLSGLPDTTGVRGRSSSVHRVLPAGRVY